ncbi:PfkB family carbohydrate kinase [uncultured Algibacter sp.]|uniref:PfkB family carbohydrate kinase n=1 Tax=uncultured Algibacter sp. TaxID=298659 RepID=UPI002625D7D6|nr:PfkB family carbohydrate kinase [uncultured Algibacter sp.]
MKGFVTFGEIMLRLSQSQIGDKILIANEFSVVYGGSESNVTTSIPCLGNKVSFISKLPNNPLGNAALLGLNKYKVDTDKVLLGGNPIWRNNDGSIAEW